MYIKKLRAMKNQKYFVKTFYKKVIITSVLIVFTFSINAQSLTQKSDFREIEKPAYNIEYFKVKEVNDKLYFKFLIIENEQNIVYTLESSTDGANFSGVTKKDGFLSPNGIPLLYCYSADQNTISTESYRIKRSSAEGVQYSSTLFIDRAEMSNLSAQLKN